MKRRRTRKRTAGRSAAKGINVLELGAALVFRYRDAAGEVREHVFNGRKSRAYVTDDGSSLIVTGIGVRLSLEG